MCGKCPPSTGRAERTVGPDFKLPYEIPSGFWGAWARCCETELLKPCPPIEPKPGKPETYGQLIQMFCEVLDIIKHLCNKADSDYNIEDEKAEGDGPLTRLNLWLDFFWLTVYRDSSNDLKNAIHHHLFVILNESILHGSYRWMGYYDPLAKALSSVAKRRETDGWGLTEQRIERITGLILEFGHNKKLLTVQLETIFVNSLDDTWLKENNDLFDKAQELSLATLEQLQFEKHNLQETLKRYSRTPGVLRLKILEKPCKGTIQYNLAYGTNKAVVRNVGDLMTFAKVIFMA